MRMIKSFGRWLSSLKMDERGVSAVEFAMIAPLMILLYFGILEVCQATMAERRTMRTTSAVADLLAQSNATITSSDVTQIFNIANTLMKPFPTSTSTLKMCVASISASGSTTTVDWSKGTTGSDCSDKPSGNMNGLLTSGSSVIKARVIYDYQGPSSKVIRKKITFDKTFYYRPRRTSKIDCTNC